MLAVIIILNSHTSQHVGTRQSVLCIVDRLVLLFFLLSHLTTDTCLPVRLLRGCRTFARSMGSMRLLYIRVGQMPHTVTE